MPCCSCSSEGRSKPAGLSGRTETRDRNPEQRGPRLRAHSRFQVEAAEIPHRHPEHSKAKRDQCGRGDMLDQTDHQRRHDDNHHRAEAEYESGVGRRVAVKRLQHLGNQNGRSEQHKAEKEIEGVGDSEVAIFQQRQFDDRIERFISQMIAATIAAIAMARKPAIKLLCNQSSCCPRSSTTSRQAKPTATSRMPR